MDTLQVKKKLSSDESGITEQLNWCISKRKISISKTNILFKRKNVKVINDQKMIMKIQYF